MRIALDLKNSKNPIQIFPVFGILAQNLVGLKRIYFEKLQPGMFKKPYKSRENEFQWGGWGGQGS